MGVRLGLGRSAPQHIQQLVMRDYCRARGLAYLLAATEYRMPGCTMMLDGLLSELDALEGIVMYSITLFPDSKDKRIAMYRRLFDKGCELHAAVENIVIRNWDDAMRIEESWLVQDVMSRQSETLFTYLQDWDRQHADG